MGFNIFNFTRQLTKLRNAIIHYGNNYGDKFKNGVINVDNKDYTPQEFIITSESLVRNVLNEYLLLIAMNQDVLSINKNLDESFFDFLKSDSSNPQSHFRDNTV